MAVYLNAGYHRSATLTTQTSHMLGQTQTLPYFKVFDEPLLSQQALCRHLDDAIMQTLKRAGWSPAELPEIPIFLGSTAYAIADYEYRSQENMSLPTAHSHLAIANVLEKRYQTAVFNFATSCTSSAQALHYADTVLNNGFFDKALVIGFEPFNRLTFEHFQSMNLLENADSYLPFLSAEGMVLGEGLGCLALSKVPHADFVAEISHFNSVTDNDNLTNSSEQALIDLLTGTMAQAPITADAIKAIKTHAVGGRGDALEMQVLRDYFPNSDWMLLKPYLGHTLGASGAVEMAYLLACLQKGHLPKLPQQSGASPQALPLAHGKSLADGYYLNYFLGFGGSNVGWLLRWEDKS